MDVFFSPNIAYLILVLGIVAAVAAILIPGTGIPEAGTLLGLGLAFFLSTRLAINYVALFVMAVGLIFLGFTLKRPPKPVFPIVGVSLLLLGADFVYYAPAWYLTAVHPLLILFVTPAAAGFLWLIGRKTQEAQLVPVANDLQSMIGQKGEATTPIHENGTVQLSSELWSARSKEPIQPGEEVQVVGRDGFTLLVEKKKRE